MTTLLVALFTTLTVGLKSPAVLSLAFNKQFASTPAATERVLATEQFSLNYRYHVPSVSEVFKKNILLNLAYLNGSVIKKSEINWDAVYAPSVSSFTLKPGEVFAYHDHVLPEYEGKVVKTTNAHFNSQEGFVSDGYLVGDGVCHFASLINWVAQDAGLKVYVPKNHDFAAIPEIHKKYGVSIYTKVAEQGSGVRNNLYITNTLSEPITFRFEYTADGQLKISVIVVNGSQT